MKRKIIEKLKAWKNSEARKTLILEGARQVGKTWALKEFGKTEYDNFVYVNCDNNPTVNDIFIDFDVKRILRNLSAISNETIVPGKTLIIFDEIQECPKALTSLKYFCEDDNEYHVAVAGSLLGLLNHQGSGFPVGKVESLYLAPLSFMEFLMALEKDILVQEMQNHNWANLYFLNPQITELLRQYYFTGGMPEAVLTYVQTQNLQQVRKIQKQILSDYEKDMSKHATKSELVKITQVWNSIPSQLAKENKKFIYGVIKSGGRAKEFENAIQWLINAGLIHKVNAVSKIENPLKFYEELGSFKLFMNDLGLMAAMMDASPAEILVGNNGFTNFKGSFTEQYVLQQYVSVHGESPFYYSNENSTMEIDFVIQNETVFPVEVKAEENLKSKSLSTVLKNNSNLFGLRFSMANYKTQERMVNVPLGLAEEYFNWIYETKQSIQ